MSRIAVIGTGYVGLTCGACFSHLGHDVVCVDVDPAKIERLRQGKIPIIEHGLGDLVTEGIRHGNLRFALTDDEHFADIIRDRQFVFLCLPTPQGEDGAADLSYVRQAAAELAPLLASGTVVVNKSTVPVGSADLVASVLARPDVTVASNPEFLREGSAVADFLKPDRIVVGSSDPAAANAVAHLYSSLEAPILITDPESAETIKYAANAFLATKLSFVNAIAAICEGVDADVVDVLQGMGLDRRIGSEFLRPGPGWGGSCFPKDTRALLQIATSAGYQFDLLDAVVRANDDQFDRISDKIRHAAGGSLAGAAVAVWGLTFKAGTDDLRDSPSMAIVTRLMDQGAHVTAFDPAVADGHPTLDPRLTVAPDALSAVKGAGVLALLTEWPEFRIVEPSAVAQLMTNAAVIDGRNLLDRDAWRKAGFHYSGIGRQ